MSSEFRFPTLVLPKATMIESGLGRPTYLLPNIADQQMLGTGELFPASTALISFTHPSYPNGDRGKIFLPPGMSNANQVKGLVLMAPGQLVDTFENTFKYSMDHIGMLLAFYGYICVCVQPRPENGSYSLGTTLTYLRHLDHYNTKWFFASFVKGKPLALIGHSQAGKRAVEAGELIRFNKLAGYSSVNAVVSLAGTHNIGANLNPATAFLGIRGDRDRDVSPSYIDPLTLRQYCRVGGTERRFFLWMRNCNHIQNTRRPPGNTDYIIPDKVMDNEVVGCDAQNIAVAQHTAMFILWRLGGLSQFGAVFRGEKRVKLISPVKNIQDDFSHKLRVLPLFDTLQSKPLSTPDEVKFEQMLQDGMAISASNLVKYDVLDKLDPSCVGYEGLGFVVGWNTLNPQTPKPVISVKCNSNLLLPGVTAIEFHAIMFFNKDNISDIAKVKVYFKYGINSVSTAVEANIESGYNAVNSVVSTISIPLWQFNIPDKLAQVKSLIIDFSGSFVRSGTVAISLVRVGF